MRNLVFSEQDFKFIEQNYPELYQLLNRTAIKRGNSIYYPMFGNIDYDEIFDKFMDCIADSIDEKIGDLSENGLEIERIWDWADGAEEWDDNIISEVLKGEIRRFIYQALRKRPINAWGTTLFEKHLNDIEQEYFDNIMWKCKEWYKKGLLVAYTV